MRRSIKLFFLLLLPLAAQGQFVLHPPSIGEGPYAITDTVYIGVDGDDANAGTVDAPVKTFLKALQLLPFGTPGVNGGHAYGLIRFLPGVYIQSNGFFQSTSQWNNGNTYKNVSVEGIGEVQIGGEPDAFITPHALRLMGSHIYVRNLSVKYTTGIGLLIGRDDMTQPRLTDVLIDNVRIDSVGSFCMLLRDIDRVEVMNSRATRSARPDSETLTSPCQWPSGIKFLYSTHCVIHHSEVEYSRGEGLNFHNVQNGLAYENRIHDNPTNIYNDNSKNLIIRNNLVYNTPGFDQYWRTCPADTAPRLAPRGILLANEGSCRQGGGVFQNCVTNCLLTGESFPNVDSVFIYNNIFQNVGAAFSFWEGVTSNLGFNCIRNVFIFHNTCLSNLGDPGASNSEGMANFFFPAIYNTITNANFAIGQNIQIRNNLFVQDPQGSPFIPPVRVVRDNFFPTPLGLSFDNNLWSQTHTWLGSGDEVRAGLPSDLPLLLDSLHLVQPCADQPDWIFAVPEIGEPWLDKDYRFDARQAGITQAGALEYRDMCEDISSLTAPAPTPARFRVSPNPTHDGRLQIEPSQRVPFEVNAFDALGRPLGKWRFAAGWQEAVDLQLPNGSYGVVYLQLISDGYREVQRVVRLHF